MQSELVCACHVHVISSNNLVAAHSTAAVLSAKAARTKKRGFASAGGRRPAVRVNLRSSGAGPERERAVASGSAAREGSLPYRRLFAFVFLWGRPCTMKDSQNLPDRIIVAPVRNPAFLQPFATVKKPWAILLCKFSNESAAFDRQHYDNLFTTSGQGTLNMVAFFEDMSHGLLDLSDSKTFGPFTLTLRSDTQLSNNDLYNRLLSEGISVIGHRSIEMVQCRRMCERGTAVHLWLHLGCFERCHV